MEIRTINSEMIMKNYSYNSMFFIRNSKAIILIINILSRYYTKVLNFRLVLMLLLFKFTFVNDLSTPFTWNVALI